MNNKNIKQNKKYYFDKHHCKIRRNVLIFCVPLKKEIHAILE